MYPFWEMVVAPVVAASQGRRVLEIGALRGETTAKMFDQLGPDSELHVIDPLPQFDPTEHERAFPGRYIFHRALSLEVLPDLPAFDVALIDGDHNWYTVYHELQHLDATARAANQPLPVLVLHDVAWPYGHRDLYYEPSQIPDEFRQPHRRAGLAPGRYRVLDDGGFNADLHNAIDGGGPRNGVRRALDDFLADHPDPVRQIVLPFYFGLAIVVPEARIAANPRLGRLLDRFESAEGRERLLKLSEKIRIDEAVHTHNTNRITEQRIARHRDRWLDLLKATLLDEPYLENEVRLEYLESLPPGTAPDPAKLRDPARTLYVRYNRMAQARRAGRSTARPTGSAMFPYTDMGRPALDHLQRAVASLAERDVPGDVVECGVGRGGGGVFLRACLEAYGLGERTLWMVDRFVASDPSTELVPTSQAGQVQADLQQVRDAFERFDLVDERIRYLQGDPKETLPSAPEGPIALLRVGIGATSQLRGVLGRLLPRLAPGAAVVIEGASQPRVGEAVAKARAQHGITDPLVDVDWNTITWQASGPAPDTTTEATPATPPLPLAPPVTTQRCSLSVVVVFYDMRREAPRTLRSLSRSYQRDIGDLDYEVVVVDNGSHPDQALSAEEVASFGPEFRLLDVEGPTPPSPTVALNRGIAATRGETVAVMIDGAHVLTPGVFRHAMDAADLYGPAVVAVQQWYVGPGQQGDAQQAGYDQAVEDRLFKTIRWPTDGYRLFEIGHFIGDRDWFDGIIESNCLFAPRSLLEQVGGFDDRFDMAGGGYANLELFERLHSHPDVTPTSILGEATFHQFHGGTTTNVADEAVRRDRVFSYGTHFRELRNRGLLGLNKPVHYVGAMDTKAARRTRSRREFLLSFDAEREPGVTATGPPLPVPEELKFAAIEAVWDNRAWQEATWLGHPVNRYPTDLQSYQELVTNVGPDAVVVVGDDQGLGGRALLAASVCDQLDHGRVIAVGRGADTVPDHPRLTGVAGAGESTEVAARVAELVDGGSALVVVGLGAVERVLQAFDHYAPLVPVGSYVVIENTVVNGRPVDPAFGPGPHEAVVQILGTRSQFVADVSYERYTVTFNKSGYLRRMADG